MKTHVQKIIPHFWFDKGAKEAAEFYCSVFPDSKVTSVTTLHDTPSGDVDTVTFELWGQKFMAIDAGPLFKFNPSISFFVNFDPSREENASKKLDAMWQKLSEGGTVLMPLDKYPFSERYGWIEDKYGLSWQLILTDPEGDPRPPIVPSLLFVNDVCGKAEEAMNFYLSMFKNSKQGFVARYPKGLEPDQEGTLMFADFMLENQWFAAMDSAHEHQFNFNEAISLMVYCDTQVEIDDYWQKLSAVPEAEQRGWLKDRYGVSWQIVPTAMDEMMSQNAPQRLYLMQVGSMPEYEIPIVCYLVQTGDGKNILIDSGLPEIIPEDASEFENGRDVIEQLANIGLKPDDIDTVISTHYDGDHAGRHAAFTKAQYVVQRVHHLDAASNPRYAAIRPEWDQPMERIRLVDGDTELLPGLELIETSGHVPGHQSVLVRLPKTGAILLTIDAVPFGEGFTRDEQDDGSNPDAEVIRASTIKLLDLVEREHIGLVIFGHDKEQWETLKIAPEFYE